jgi:dolichol-phosphate mannosyltransferase
VIELSVVLPTYNECENVVPLLERIAQSLAGRRYEVLVVDDDSPDGTAAVVARHAANHPAVQVVERVGIRGLRSAIQEGVDRSRGDAVAWLDCDASMPPELLPQLLDALNAADVAVGSRYVAGGADARSDVPVHRLLSRMLNRFNATLLGAAITDYTSGFICARRVVLRDIRLAGDYGEYCIDLLHRARKRGYRVIEVPYRNTPRAHGKSKTATNTFGLVRRGWRYVALAIRLRLELGA